MKSIPVKYAFVALAITISWTLIEHVLGFNTTKHEIGEYTRLVTAYIFYAIIFYAIWKQRKLRNNVLSFAQGMRTGAQLALIYSVLVSCWFALYAEVINPQYQSTVIAYERGKLEAANASAQAIATKMKEVEMVTGGSVVAYLFLALFMFVGAMVPTIIASLILKRKAVSS